MMNIEELEAQYVEVKKQARYVTYGDLSEHTIYYWFVMHGSRMLCDQMIHKFQNFDPKEHFIVAPEALSRFYMDGFGGEVVASWMTNRDRLHEIDDNANFLSTLYNMYRAKMNEGCISTILGFSQGGTIAFRWLHNTAIEADNFIPYSCWIPEDIDLRKGETKMSNLKIIYVYGEDDPYINKEAVIKINGIAKRNKLPLIIENYQGDHRVDKSQIKYIFNKHLKKA